MVVARRNPYLIEGPAVLSISGGRTSAFMLHKIIEAHGGNLPDDVLPIFCNTGVEHENTLHFLREIEERWNVPLVWLEYAPNPDTGGHWYKIADYCSASRNGEPFSALIDYKKMLPNPVARFCTSELKIRTIKRYCENSLAWDEWTEVVGLRADEPWRAQRIQGDTTRQDVACPMYDAGHALADVLLFWREQPFDLQLASDIFGNCTLCFLKGAGKIAEVMRANPEYAQWWIEQESKGLGNTSATFRSDRPTYKQMLTQITVQGRLFDDAFDDDTLPCMCHD